jgi:hypothetical protein
MHLEIYEIENIKNRMFKMDSGSENLNLDYQCVVTMAKDFRIELHKLHYEQLKKYKIREFYIGRISGSKAVALCPSTYWDRFVTEQKAKYSNRVYKNPVEDFYYTKSQPVYLDKQRKIRIPKPYRNYFDRSERKIHVLPKGYYLILYPAKALSEDLSASHL